MNSMKPPSLQRGSKVCRSTDWLDVVQFCGLIFVVHALTVVALPGANDVETTIASLLAILMPDSGAQHTGIVLMKGVFMCRGGELDVAPKAGTLCTLVLSTLVKPKVMVQVSPLITNIHGQYPRGRRRVIIERASPVLSGYGLVEVPATFEAVAFLIPAGGDRKQASILKRNPWKEHPARAHTTGMWRLPWGGFTPLEPSCNYSLIRSSAPLIQILYGGYELYMISEEQIKRNGYAAYQFAVIPYVTMSKTGLQIRRGNRT